VLLAVLEGDWKRLVAEAAHAARATSATKRSAAKIPPKPKAAAEPEPELEEPQLIAAKQVVAQAKGKGSRFGPRGDDPFGDVVPPRFLDYSLLDAKDCWPCHKARAAAVAAQEDGAKARASSSFESSGASLVGRPVSVLDSVSHLWSVARLLLVSAWCLACPQSHRSPSAL